MITAAYYAPRSLDEALALLARHGDGARPLAGGQSLTILLRHGFVAPEVLVDLKRIAGLEEIAVADGRLTVGATATYRRVAGDERVRAGWPLLAEAVGSVGSIHIRNRGTLGGSVAHADPAGDSTVALLALDGVVEVAATSGQRSVPIDEFEVEAHTTVLDPTELVTAIRVPAPPPGSTWAYLRFSRREGEFPIAQVAVRTTWVDDRVADVRVAAGGAGDVPHRLRDAEAALVGSPVDEASIERAVEAARPAVQPLVDVRGSGEWRRDVVLAILGRALRRAARLRGAAGR
jgi:carbon-monoxide dehydrogenase medium subunit